MEVPLEITFRNMEPSDFLERKIRARVAKLHKFFGRITSCHVALEVPHRSPHHPMDYHVRIEVKVPQKEPLVVSRDPGDRTEHRDAHVAIRDAFEAMERRLEAHSQIMRGTVKAHPEALQGRILRKFRDHGFIATTDEQEIYFHRNSVVDSDFDSLAEGDPVELVIAHGESPAGPQATTVKAIGPMELRREPATSRLRAEGGPGSG